MYFKQVHIGGYDDNLNYFIGDRESREVAVVDPDNLPLLNKIIKEEDLKVVAILLTHGHFDHTSGCEEMQKQSGAKIYLHEKNSKLRNLDIEHCVVLKGGAEINIGEVKIKVISTPGHTPGSVCYYIDPRNMPVESGYVDAGKVNAAADAASTAKPPTPKLITGDTLFIGGCGRCDLAGGDPHQMYNSLFNVIGKLPDDTEIYPGHDYGVAAHASLAHEKAKNRFYRCDSLESFLKERMGF